MPVLSKTNQEVANEAGCRCSQLRPLHSTGEQDVARHVLEKNITVLENGQHALTFSSGLAACRALTKLLHSGDEVLVAEDVYGGSYYLIEDILSRQNVRVRWVDTRNAAEVEKAISRNTKLLWLETPSNPLLRLADLTLLAELAKKHNVTTVVDNTLATPCLQKPLDLGVDIVLHSSVKYISGYTGISGGALITSRLDLFEALQFSRNAWENVLESFDCFCILRGMRSLTLRVQQQEQNTKKIADFLNGHESVLVVHYPGLSSHPQHELACRQMSGFGNLLTFELKRGAGAAYAMIRNTRLFAFYEKMANIGPDPHLPYGSFIAHAKIPAQVLARHGGRRTTSLVRLFIVPENADDLIEDLDRALASIKLCH